MDALLMGCLEAFFFIGTNAFKRNLAQRNTGPCFIQPACSSLSKDRLLQRGSLRFIPQSHTHKGKICSNGNQ